MAVLGGGLHQAPPWDQAPLPRAFTPRTRHPTPEADPPGPGTPPVNRMTNRCKNITLPQTLFAGGNKKKTSLWCCFEYIFQLGVLSLILYEHHPCGVFDWVQLRMVTRNYCTVRVFSIFGQISGHTGDIFSFGEINRKLYPTNKPHLVILVTADLHSKIFDTPRGANPFNFNFLSFWEFFSKSYVGAPPPPMSWRPNLWEILDPSLVGDGRECITISAQLFHVRAFII